MSDLDQKVFQIMAHEVAGAPVCEPLDIGKRLKQFRTDAGHSLATLASLTGISEASLSRVENGQVLVSAHNLYVLSQVLEVDITAFYAPTAHPLRAGIRSVSRRGGGEEISTERFLSKVYASDLSRKKMHPALNIISARTLEEAGGVSAHTGEEFLFVVKGKLVLHSEHYAPLLLEEADTLYFDGAMPHAYVCGSDLPAEVLVITTVDSHSV